MFAAKILADSVSRNDVRLTTLEVTFPRFILAEVNTHRMLSRNSASSRAIPIKKAIQMVEEDPFIPEEFGKNKPGMAWDDTTLDDVKSKRSRTIWKDAMKEAIYAASMLDEMEVHKALANRILEPFKWHTAIISATDWDNFFALRTDANAQPEFRKIAEMMKEAMEESIPLGLDDGQWHLPLVHNWELITDCPNDLTGGIIYDWDLGKKLAVGRCARVSYETHDGKRDLLADVRLHDMLKTNGHLSPFEHVATPARNHEDGFPDMRYHGNFKGYIQYRKFIPNESNFAKVKGGYDKEAEISRIVSGLNCS